MQSINHYDDDDDDDDDDGDGDGDGDNDGDEQWDINQSFIQARPLQFHPQLQQVVTGHDRYKCRYKYK